MNWNIARLVIAAACVCAVLLADGSSNYDRELQRRYEEMEERAYNSVIDVPKRSSLMKRGACDFTPGVNLDCNSNAISDDCDIANGTSLDVDGNGIPDECCSIARNDTFVVTQTEGGLLDVLANDTNVGYPENITIHVLGFYNQTTGICTPGSFINVTVAFNATTNIT